MQTDTVAACYIENNDHIVQDGTVVGYVYMVDEADNDMLVFDVVDDEGGHIDLFYAPFDPVTFVTSFDEDVDIPDVEV